jgi:hypothetical protein
MHDNNLIEWEEIWAAACGYYNLARRDYRQVECLNDVLLCLINIVANEKLRSAVSRRVANHIHCSFECDIKYPEPPYLNSGPPDHMQFPQRMCVLRVMFSRCILLTRY